MNNMQIMTGRRSHPITALLTAGAILVSANAAHAQDEDAKAVTFSGNATFVSDYRFRGLSLSNKDPAVQAGINMNTAPGFFFGIWGSSIADFNGATTEIDLTGGWSGDFGGITPSVGIVAYLYPGGTDTDIYELFGSVGATVGPVGLTVGLNVAPGQRNLRSSRYLYFAGNIGIPDTPISINGNLGFERGGLVPDETGTRTTKTDWLIGASATFDPITVGIAYTGTDLPSTFQATPFQGQRANSIGRGGIVVTLSASF